MSTLEAPRQTQSGGTRLRSRLLALGALIAAGAAAVILALSGSDHATTTYPAIGTQARPYAPSGAAPSAAPAGNFRDPTTHKLVRIGTPGPTTQAAPSSEPTLQSVLRKLTPAQRRYVLGIAGSTRAQQAAAFGTDPGLSGLTGRQIAELGQWQSAAEQLGLHPGTLGNASQR